MQFTHPYLVLLVIGTTGVFALQPLAQAQITAATDGTNTQINLIGNTLIIRDGTQTGANLFHSFQQFGLNQGQTANFRTNSSIQNILGRVIGGDASVINGLIQVTGGNSNLYLMNPSGIVFGANARLNVPASFAATTANGIGLGNGWFSAIGPNDYANLVSPPSTFAFTMQQPGAIVNAANLTVGEEQRLILAGGTVISTGTLTAPQGQIVITAVPGSSLVQLTEVGKLLRLEVQPLASTANQPQSWTQNIASLPALLTGSGLGNADALTINPDGSVSLTGAGLQVEQGDIAVTQPISGRSSFEIDETSLPDPPIAITMLSDNKITTGDLKVNSGGTSNRESIDLTAKGNIQTGNIDFVGTDSPQVPGIPGKNTADISDNNPPDSNGIFKGVKLFSQAGNVTVETIRTVEGDVDITAAGLFRATGFFGEAPASGIFDSQTFNIDDGYTKRLIEYLPKDQASTEFFLNKTGLTQTELDNALSTYYFAEARVYAPVSIRAFGTVTIRYGNGSSLAYGSRSDSDSLTVAGNAPFVIGPDSFPRSGDKYIPADPNDRFENFQVRSFNVIQNESYALSNIPEGVSGTRGAIVQGILANGTYFTPLQSVVFGTLNLANPNNSPAAIPTGTPNNLAINTDPNSSPATVPAGTPTNSAGTPNNSAINANPNSSSAVAPIVDTGNSAIDPLAGQKQRLQWGEDGQAAHQQLNERGFVCTTPESITSRAGASNISEKTKPSPTSISPCGDDAQILKILDGGVK